MCGWHEGAGISTLGTALAVLGSVNCADEQPFSSITGQCGPIVAAAIHDGHWLRPEVRRWLRIDEATRLREEDPFTAEWTVVGDVRIVVHRSRFEVDLNRPRRAAVYRQPADAWGLDVWDPETPSAVHDRSLERYDRFYADLQRVLHQLVERFGHVVILDLHSYNHRREDAGAPADPEANPDVNIGTGSMDRSRWAALVDGFLTDLRSAVVGGRRLDVRENVKFRGGYLSQWAHAHFPREVCALAIEVKKFFMDEWTGAPCGASIADVGCALAGTIPGLRSRLAP